MNITRMRIRITLQRNETIVDDYGNHRSQWRDVFTCWASALKGGTAEETEAAGHTTEAERLNFTVRWSSETAAVDTRHYRIQLHDQLYNIVAIDEQGFRKSTRKFITERIER